MHDGVIRRGLRLCQEPVPDPRSSPDGHQEVAPWRSSVATWTPEDGTETAGLTQPKNRSQPKAGLYEPSNWDATNTV